MKKVRTRFAPSPTGALHIGGVRTALFNYLFAKKNGGDFILRIEDTDKTREVEGAIDYITDSMKWLGFVPDESPEIGGSYGPYKQSERLDLYKFYVQELVDSGHAYLAFDTPEELDAVREKFKASDSTFVYNSNTRENMVNSESIPFTTIQNKLDAKEPYVIRFKTPKNKEIKFNDIVRGWVSFDSNQLDDKILFKSDGYPTYHLANVVDDHLMEISHVIRAEEWLPSTPLHIMLYDAFGWEKPEFCHLPLVNGPDGKKLSKRHAAKYGFPIFPLDWDYVQDGKDAHASGFKDAGFEPDALLNFLALLGWNPGSELEYMNMDELIGLFDLDRVNKSGANFNIEKLKHFNAHYVRSVDNEELFVKHMFDLTPDNTPEYSDLNIIKIVDIAKKRSVFTKDLYPSVSYFFEPVILADDIVMKNPKEFREVMYKFISSCKSEFGVYDEISEEDIKLKLEEICAELGYKLGKVLPDLRTALTGGIPGPELQTTMAILGMTESVKRILALNEKYIYQDCK
jgi:glutamyl-tRNA synthetase